MARVLARETNDDSEFSEKYALEVVSAFNTPRYKYDATRRAYE